MGWALLALMLFVSVVLHELGHVLAFRRYHVRLRGIGLGFPRLYTRKVRDMEVSVGLIPLMVYVEPDYIDFEVRCWSTWRKVFTYLAGPIVTLTLAVVAYLIPIVVTGRQSLMIAAPEENGCNDPSSYAAFAVLISDTYHQFGVIGVLQMFALMNFVILFINMMPIPLTDGGNIMLILMERVFGRRVSGLITGLKILGLGVAFLLSVRVISTEVQNVSSKVEGSPNYVECIEAP